MVKGTRFKVDGYELVASAYYAETGGEALVLSNNSTHYLVATREDYFLNPRDIPEAVLEDSFRYGENLAPAYKMALTRMSEIAMAR